jgi:acyl carrier protein
MDSPKEQKTELNMGMTQDQVFAKVQQVLVEALGVDEEDVKPQARLVADLGAESIDFLDIVFRLEKAFGVKLDQKELFPEGVLNDPKYVQNGKVTDAGIEALRQRLPHTDLTAFEKSRNVQEFSNVFTVDAIVKFMAARVG